jgi:hypothetical protein
MSATDDDNARREHGVAWVQPSFSGDVRIGLLLIDEVRQRVVVRVLGVPRDEQSLLLTIIFAGTVAGGLRGLARRPWPRPSGSDVAVGASLLNATLAGIAGAPARNMPAAGALIAGAVVWHSARPIVVGSVRDARAVARDVRAAFGARYGTRLPAPRRRTGPPGPSA